MMRCEVELEEPNDIKAFEDKCKDPEFVVKCLEKYEKWRHGIGKYGKCGSPMPFCARAVSIFLDAAIDMVRKLGVVRRVMNGQ